MKDIACRNQTTYYIYAPLRAWLGFQADVAVHKAQEAALEAFGHGPEAFNALIRSRWPLLSFLARLRPRSGRDSVLVSWSSREVGA